MKKSSERTSSDRKQLKIKKAHTVADNVRQEFNWCWITGVLSGNDKAERSRHDIFYRALTLDGSRGGTPLWAGWTKEFRTHDRWMILLDMRG